MIRQRNVRSLPRPERFEPPALTLPRVIRSTLVNQIGVLLVERPRLPLVDVLLVVTSGCASDAPEHAGLASLTADLLDAGTTARSEIDIARELDTLGARFDIAPHWDYTTLALQTHSALLEPALAVLADVAMAASFPGPEFERGKQERLASILHDQSDPETLANFAIASAVFGDHHIFGRPASGTRSTVERIDRDAVVRHYRAHYRPANAFVVMVGELEASSALAAVDRALGIWQAGAEGRTNAAPAAEPRGRVIRLLDRPGAPQSEIRIGTVGAARTSPDYFPLLVLNTILGGSFTSRLNQRLREQGGYTYGAYSSFSFRRVPGPFVVAAAVGTAVTAQAIAESFEEIARIREEPVGASELERAKRYLVLGLPRGFETNGGIASRLAETEVHGLGERFWSEYAASVGAVDAVAVQDVAQRYLAEARLSVAVVGDAARVRPGLEALGLGPVEAASPPE